jgi:hypothetical protein
LQLCEVVTEAESVLLVSHHILYKAKHWYRNHTVAGHARSAIIRIRNIYHSLVAAAAAITLLSFSACSLVPLDQLLHSSVSEQAF